MFGVCLSVAQLWNLLILTSEAASTSLPVPPPASTWKTDRQADRQLPSQPVKLSPLTPTWGSQVCTWKVTVCPSYPYPP